MESFSVPKVSSKSSKKRAFSEGSSSDSDVIEVSPRSAKRSANLRALKNKDVNEDHEILMKFQNFKKFDIVQDPSDHHFVHKRASKNQPSKSWSKTIQEEWKMLEKDLPDSILIRTYEARMDLMRAVIVGVDKTPYHDGLFFFDVFFPQNYPDVPPLVYHHSHGLQLNPSLDNSGNVCLSLLNLSISNQPESWIPRVSTMLQVLVSLQGLVLNAKPYYNHHVLSFTIGTPFGDWGSMMYNEKIFLLSLKTMVFTLQQQPKHFEDFVVGHFFIRAKDILVACKSYKEGAQVGCLAEGGIQDLDAGDKSSSIGFRASVAEYINVIADAFTQIGVKGLEQFIHV